MRHIFIYVSGLLFFHAMPPLVAARKPLAELSLQPHLVMYASAALVAVFVLRAQWVMQPRCLLATLICLSAAALLILSQSPEALVIGFLIIGATVPVLIRHAFEDAANRDRSVGNMLGFSSFFLEGMALSIGVLATFVSTSFAQLFLAMVPVLTLLWVSRSLPGSPNVRVVPKLQIRMTIQDVIPAVAANTAFFLFLSSISMAGSQISPLQIGSAIAVTAIGFASGAFLSDRIRLHLPDRVLLIVFSLSGLLAGLLGSLFSLNDVPALIYVIAIGISLSNGVIISIALSSKRLQQDQKSGLPADNALVFLMASGFVALVLTFIAAQVSQAATWSPIVLTYLVSLAAIVFRRDLHEMHPDLRHLR